MIKQNQAEFDKSNITYWHSKGYKGKGVTVVVLDSNGKPHDFTNVEMPIFKGKNDTDHITYVCGVVREVAPDVRIIAFNWLGGGNKKDTVDWIVEHKDEIDIISCSWHGTVSAVEFDRLKDLNIPIVCASGNNSNDDKIPRPARHDWTIAVGAWLENTDRKASYSNGSKELDTVSYTNIYVPRKDGSIFPFTGTSCSTPFVSGMLACYLSWRKENGLPRLGREEIRKFIHDNSIDKLTKGHDYKSGYGLFVLPKEIPQIEVKPELPKEEEDMSFKDVNGHWAKDYIDFVVDKGLMNGKSVDTFEPNAPLTRAELATVIARMNGFVPKK